MQRFSLYALLLAVITTFSSCDLVYGVFKAGLWSGIIVVVLVVAIIFWLISRFTGRRRL